MPKIDLRRDILDMYSRVSLEILNLGNSTTFKKSNYGQIFPDISLAMD